MKPLSPCPHHHRRRRRRPLTPTSCCSLIICTAMIRSSSRWCLATVSAVPLTFIVPTSQHHRHSIVNYYGVHKQRSHRIGSINTRRMQLFTTSPLSSHDTIENNNREEESNDTSTCDPPSFSSTNYTFNNTRVVVDDTTFNCNTLQNYENNDIYIATPTSKTYTAFINAIDSLSTKRNVVRDLRSNNTSDLIIVKEYMANTNRILPRWDVNDYLLPVGEEEGICSNNNDNNNNHNIETSSSATTVGSNIKQRIRYRSEQFLSIINLTIPQYRLASVLIAHLADDCARTSNIYPIYMAWEKILECGITPLSRTLSTFLYVLGLPPAKEEEEEEIATGRRKQRDGIATEVAMYHDALYSPTEKTIAILVKSFVARGDAKGAEALLDGIPPSSSSTSLAIDDDDDGAAVAQQLLLRHRTTSPILKLYCDQGDIDSAIRLYQRMRQTSRVKMDTATYVDFIAAVARNGYFCSNSKGIVLPATKEQQESQPTVTTMRGPELLNLLISEMAEDVLDISEELAGVLRMGFMAGFSENNVNNAAATMLLDSGECTNNNIMMMTPLTTTTSCHDNRSLIANRVIIDKHTALCSATGVKLRFMILDTTQRVHVHDTLLDMAREKSMEYTSRLAAKGRSTTDNVKAAETASQILREFSDWLDTRAGPPYTAIVDGANVAYFGWGRVNVYQLVHMVNELERRGEYPLVIFPQKYTNQRFHLRRGMMQVLRDEEMEALEMLKAKGQMYVVPPMCLDDLCKCYNEVCMCQ